VRLRAKALSRSSYPRRGEHVMVFDRKIDERGGNNAYLRGCPEKIRIKVEAAVLRLEKNLALTARERANAHSRQRGAKRKGEDRGKKRQKGKRGRTRRKDEQPRYRKS